MELYFYVFDVGQTVRFSAVSRANLKFLNFHVPAAILTCGSISAPFPATLHGNAQTARAGAFFGAGCNARALPAD
jgi:hypothetical protein